MKCSVGRKNWARSLVWDIDIPVTQVVPTKERMIAISTSDATDEPLSRIVPSFLDVAKCVPGDRQKAHLKLGVGVRVGEEVIVALKSLSSPAIPSIGPVAVDWSTATADDYP
jgi:hypothetical protein